MLKTPDQIACNLGLSYFNMSQIVVERERWMRRAMSRYVPLDVAVHCVMEFVLSFMVIQHMLDTPDSGILLTNGSISLMHPVNYLTAVLTFTICAVVVGISSFQSTTRPDTAKLLGAACLAGLTAFPLFMLLSGLFIEGSATARGLWLARILGAWLATIALFRLIFSFFMQRAGLPRRILIIGDPDRIQAVSSRLKSRRGRQFEPLLAPPGTPHLDTTSAGALSWSHVSQQGIWGIIVAFATETALPEPLLDWKLRGMTVLSDQAFQEQHLGRIDVDGLTVKHLLPGDDLVDGLLSLTLKRGCDLMISAALLLMTLPLMVLTSLAIKLDSAGPVLYRQQRIGHFGRTFTVLKFRSMYVDAEACGAPRWAQKQDPRITKVGAFIRATRIDELPQLVNIILGEMSLVGPRPERPHFVEQLTLAIPFYRERSYVKPGLTGWAQINFPYGASVEDAREKLAYDLYYLKHRGILLDLRILLSTIRVVLFCEGGR
ncbi:exopolysaccharide biosynthesis polyprenyl glycosylphosphotransferase [Rhodopila sp.]|uniref:exopolysaccharide biosynthesis polyprenyl glycosylphosphotransferase n=1 Tax=Rhodopila sp. TaxID=2480087 RepID=UPI003D12509F